MFKNNNIYNIKYINIINKIHISIDKCYKNIVKFLMHIAIAIITLFLGWGCRGKAHTPYDKNRTRATYGIIHAKSYN